MSRPATRRRRAPRFRELHEGEPFVIPNPWDAGSAKVLASLGFEALATTSARLRLHARAPRRRGRPSTRSCEHVARARRGDRPAGLGRPRERLRPARPTTRRRRSPARRRPAPSAARSRTSTPRTASTSSGSRAERVAAAVEAARALDFPFTLTARAENHIRGNPDLDDTIARLRAYEEAGADVLYAPGLRIAGGDRGGLRGGLEAGQRARAAAASRSSEIFAAGAQRVSVGGSLAWVAVDGAGRRPRRRFATHGDLSTRCADLRRSRRLLG